MDLKNKYYHFVSALTPEICSKIIDHGTSIIKKNKELGLDTSGTTFGDKHKSAIKDGKPQEDKSKQQLKKDKINDNLYVRDSEIAWLNDQWIYDLIIPYIKKANLFSGWNFQFDAHEEFQFTVYNPGGFYGWHTDGGSDIHASYNISVGIGSGFVSYVVIRLIQGRRKDIHPLLFLVAGLFMIYFLSSPINTWVG
jgi:hypothetical protein